MASQLWRPNTDDYRDLPFSAVTQAPLKENSVFTFKAHSLLRKCKTKYKDFNFSPKKQEQPKKKKKKNYQLPRIQKKKKTIPKRNKDIFTNFPWFSLINMHLNPTSLQKYTCFYSQTAAKPRHALSVTTTIRTPTPTQDSPDHRLINSTVITGILLTPWMASPWYNHTGWPGVKHQVTYLPRTVRILKGGAGGGGGRKQNVCC